MNIDIRKHILNNFKGADKSEIKASIEASLEKKEEITLPGLGVFFEVFCTLKLRNVISLVLCSNSD